MYIQIEQNRCLYCYVPVKHTLHESIYVTVNCVLRLGANAWGWCVCVYICLDTNHAGLFVIVVLLVVNKYIIFSQLLRVEKTGFFLEAASYKMSRKSRYPALCYKVCFIIHHAFLAVDTCSLVCWNWRCLVSSSFNPQAVAAYSQSR